MLSPPEWTSRAACRGLATAEADPWHPADHRADLSLPYAIARRVCASCPVRLECCKYGLSLLPVVEVRGMFGGLTPAGLRGLARDLEEQSRVVAQHGSRAAYMAGCRARCCRSANAAYEHARRYPDGGALPLRRGHGGRRGLRHVRPGGLAVLLLARAAGRRGLSEDGPAAGPCAQGSRQHTHEGAECRER